MSKAQTLEQEQIMGSIDQPNNTALHQEKILKRDWKKEERTICPQGDWEQKSVYFKLVFFNLGNQSHVKIVSILVGGGNNRGREYSS